MRIYLSASALPSTLSAWDAVALTASLSTVLPAAFRLARVRSGAGLSAGTQTSLLASAVCWVWYSAQAGLPVAAMSSLLFVALFAALASFAFFAGGARDTPGPPLLIVVAVAAAYLLGGLVAVAVTLGAVPLVTEIPQLRLLVRGDAPALSIPAYFFAAVRALAWLPYAFVERDLATALHSLSTLTVAVLIIGMLLLSRRRMRAAVGCVDRRPRLR
jgi:signal transduction histidine kinase